MAKPIRSGMPKPDVPSNPLTIAILGAGNRGQVYAHFATLHPQWLKVVAVADNRKFTCKELAKKHNIPKKNIFTDWAKFVKVPKLCDAVAICTPDRQHTVPAVACANLKYHILLEKPMATSVEDCVKICEAVMKNDIILSVFHVFRYTKYTSVLKKILDSKVLGDLVSIQHLEPVGFWHFAHSYVRGNWHNEAASSFSLLAKSCHDIDLLAYYMNSKFKKVSSFGSLHHFRKENKPKEAGNAKNCLDCSFEPQCPYSAKKIYIKPHVDRGLSGWPLNIVQPNGIIDVENLTAAIQNGNYGKCVYEMDNDVCDHQVVNIEYENGSSASFTMIAYTGSMSHRRTRIFGTKGELAGDGVDKITYFEFLNRKKHIIRPSLEEETEEAGHGGGSWSYGLLWAFVYACITGNKDYVITGPQTTLDSHMCVFAAEHSRKSGAVVDIEEFRKNLPVLNPNYLYPQKNHCTTM